MIDLTTILTILFSILQFSAYSASSNDDSRNLKRNVGIADIYLGKNGNLTVELHPEGAVSLELYSLEGQLVEPPRSFIAPTKVEPNFSVPKPGLYLMVARHGGNAEPHLVYVD